MEAPHSEDEESDFVPSDGDDEVDEAEAIQEMMNDQLRYGTGEGFEDDDIAELPEDTSRIRALSKARSDRQNLLSTQKGKLYNNLLRSKLISLEHARMIMNGYPVVIAGECHNLYMDGGQAQRTKVLVEPVDYYLIKNERFSATDPAVDELVAFSILRWMTFEEFVSGPENWSTLRINPGSQNRSTFIKAWNNSTGFSTRILSENTKDFGSKIDRWVAAYYYLTYLWYGGLNDPSSDFYGVPWSLQANTWFEQMLVCSPCAPH